MIYLECSAVIFLRYSWKRLFIQIFHPPPRYIFRNILSIIGSLEIQNSLMILKFTYRRIAIEYMALTIANKEIHIV